MPYGRLAGPGWHLSERKQQQAGLVMNNSLKMEALLPTCPWIPYLPGTGRKGMGNLSSPNLVPAHPVPSCKEIAELSESCTSLTQHFSFPSVPLRPDHDLYPRHDSELGISQPEITMLLSPTFSSKRISAPWVGCEVKENISHQR